LRSAFYYYLGQGHRKINYEFYFLEE